LVFGNLFPALQLCVRETSMIKPGSRDIKANMLISGEELKV